MRILALADLHGDHNLYEWLVNVSVEYDPDAIILAGDLLGCPDGYETVEEAQRADASKILKVLDRVRPPLFYIMGNDDLVELESNKSTVRSIHGERVELGDINFVGYQYSLPFMGGIFEKPEVEIRKDLTLIETLLDQCTVLVTHSPAYGVLDVGVLDEKAGSKAMKDLIDYRNPMLHIHGHIHREFGHKGRHFNVSADGLLRAVLIDTSTLEHEVISKQQF